MRILLTGASGQVGHAVQALATSHKVLAPSHTELPIEDAAACQRVVTAFRPDWIVHPAAMTDVDACERDPNAAQAINALGAENLARAAQAHGARMALVSTDYVFDGSKGNYTETDKPNPTSAYGRSKLAGEQRVQALLPDAIIARTSVVFGANKNNFVQWVRRSLAAGKPFNVVHDQWVTPTCAHDVARQLLALLQANATGVWHTAGAQRLSRLEMAYAIAKHDGLDASPIQSVPMSAMTWLAPRPRDSSLDTQKIRTHIQPLTFSQALDTLGAP